MPEPPELPEPPQTLSSPEPELSVSLPAMPAIVSALPPENKTLLAVDPFR